MSMRAALITLVAVATLTLVALEWPVSQHEAPVAATPAPNIPQVKPAPTVKPTPPPAPQPAQPTPAATADVPGDPLSQPENPTEQFMHSRRDDGQHSE